MFYNLEHLILTTQDPAAGFRLANTSHPLSPVYKVQCTGAYTVQCTMCTVQCTLYNVQCAMYNVQCTMYIVHVAKLGEEVSPES